MRHTSRKKALCILIALKVSRHKFETTGHGRGRDCVRNYSARVTVCIGCFVPSGDNQGGRGLDQRSPTLVATVSGKGACRKCNRNLLCSSCELQHARNRLPAVCRNSRRARQERTANCRSAALTIRLRRVLGRPLSTISADAHSLPLGAERQDYFGRT